jgi:hypothetical protein
VTKKPNLRTSTTTGATGRQESRHWGPMNWSLDILKDVGALASCPIHPNRLVRTGKRNGARLAFLRADELIERGALDWDNFESRVPLRDVMRIWLPKTFNWHRKDCPLCLARKAGEHWSKREQPGPVGSVGPSQRGAVSDSLGHRKDGRVARRGMRAAPARSATRRTRSARSNPTG